jgi:hypothetical protein
MVHRYTSLQQNNENIAYFRLSYKDSHVASLYVKTYFLLIRFSVSAVLFYQYFMQLLSFTHTHRDRAYFYLIIQYNYTITQKKNLKLKSVLFFS